MTKIRNIANAIRTAWMGLPKPLRSASRDAIMGGLAVAVAAYGPSDLKAAIVAGVLAGAAIFRTKAVPYLVPPVIGTTRSEVLAEDASRQLSAANKAA